MGKSSRTPVFRKAELDGFSKAAAAGESVQLKANVTLGTGGVFGDYTDEVVSARSEPFRVRRRSVKNRRA